jgi:hypothetical protein
MLAAPVFALPVHMASFPAVKETVVIDTKNTECLSPKKISENYYQLNCKSGSVPIMLIREFKFPGTVLSEIKGTNYEDVKKLGEKAIKKKIQPWGTEYWWETPTSEKSFRAYLCPKGKNHCYYVVHNGQMEFTIKSK